MKIAMIIDWWYPVFWWWQIHVKELCKWLIKNHNCEVDLFVRKLKDNDWKKYTEDEVLYEWKLNIFRVWITTKFFNIFWRLISLTLTTFYLLYKAKTEKYDIIHAHAYVSWLPAIIVWKLYKIPVIYTIHWANNLDTNNKSLLNKIEKFLLTEIKYDLEVSVSKDFLKYKNINKNISIISNWVDINKFNKIIENQKYDWLNFLWVWRFSWEKWLEFLIKWLWLIDKKILKEKWFKLNLVWDWVEKEKIEKLVNELDLNEFIDFKWKIFWDDLIKEYKRNQVFILPSLAEWQPLTILEAFASNLPVLATDVGDNKYFLNKDNWFLFNSWNEIEIKNIIEKVLNLDISTLEKLWKSWYDLVSKNYTWDIMCEKTYYEYEKIKKLKL